jgi:MFS family permease
MRFPDFLRTCVLLFAGAATALAAVAIAGAAAKDDRALLYIALGWWGIAALVGLWLGRRGEVTQGIGRALANARTQPALPELEPGAILFNRLWALALFTAGSGALAFLVPQVPAIAAGYVIAAALAWRKQSAAVEAIEGRDGVRFYVEPTSPFKPTRLIRTPGFRRVEPVTHASASEDDRARATRARSPRDPAPPRPVAP